MLYICEVVRCQAKTYFMKKKSILYVFEVYKCNRLPGIIYTIIYNKYMEPSCIPRGAWEGETDHHNNNERPLRDWGMIDD